MKSYIINLDRSPDRWEFMQKQFSLINKDLPIERVTAIDGMRLSDETVAQHYAPELTYPFSVRTSPLTKGEIACFLSHRKCWELIAQGNDEYAAIFEDDLVLSPAVENFLANGDWIPKKANIVKLEKAADYVWADTQSVQFISDHHLYEFFSDNLGCGAYIVSRSAAASLLSNTKHFSLPVDHVVFDDRFPYFDLSSNWLVSPAVCIQLRFLEEDLKKRLAAGEDVEYMKTWIPENTAISISTLEDQRKITNSTPDEPIIVSDTQITDSSHTGVHKLSIWKKIRREWARIKSNLKRKRKNNKQIRIVYKQ